MCSYFERIFHTYWLFFQKEYSNLHLEQNSLGITHRPQELPFALIELNLMDFSLKKVLFFSLCEMMWLERLNISQTWGSDLQSFTHLYPVSQFSFLSCITAKIRKDTQRMAEDNLMKAAVQWWCGHC